MIAYNMRYRGSYEYDKFVLNILQFHNEVQDMVAEIEKDGYTLADYRNKLNNLIALAADLDLRLALIMEERQL